MFRHVACSSFLNTGSAEPFKAKPQMSGQGIPWSPTGMETITIHVPALPGGCGTFSTSDVTLCLLKWPELKWQQALAAERTQELVAHDEAAFPCRSCRNWSHTFNQSLCSAYKKKYWLSDAPKKESESVLWGSGKGRTSQSAHTSPGHACTQTPYSQAAGYEGRKADAPT